MVGGKQLSHCSNCGATSPTAANQKAPERFLQEHKIVRMSYVSEHT